LCDAFSEISLAINGIDDLEEVKKHLDGHEADSLQIIVDTLETTGLTAIGDEGLYIVKARSMNELQIQDFCEAVFSLCITLDR
jgi:hypothetical protein